MSSFADLSARIQGDVITQDHDDYAKSLHRWAINTEKKAAVVVYPKNNDDVSAAIRHARENKLPIAIHGGGHDTSGSSSVEGGLVIDLSRHLGGVRIDPAKKLAYIGGGALWAAADKAAIEHGFAIVGGSVNHVGVTGLTLAGGFGWLSSEHGLTVDSLVQVTLVTADGKVHKASETENKDLFSALRGGGSNFGVATELIFNLHEQRKTVFAGPVVFPGPRLKEIIDFASEWYANVPPGEAMFLMTTTNPEGKPIVICSLFYNGSEEEGRAKFKKLYDLGPVVDRAKEIPYEDVNALANPMVVHRNGALMRRVLTEGPVYERLAKSHEKITELAKEGFKVNAIYEWYSTKKMNAVPPGTTAIRRSPKAQCLIVLGWPQNTHTEKKAEEANLAMNAVAGSIGIPPPAPPPGSPPKPLAEIIFGENYPALQKVKAKYDPDNVFNRWFPISPN